MADSEEWRFGDEPSGAVCPVCGKANRAGQVHCATCGTPLDGGPEADPTPLRTIGEAMAAGRSSRRRRRAGWAWPTAMVALFAAVGGGYWWSLAPQRLAFDEATMPTRGTTPAVAVASPAVRSVEQAPERPAPSALPPPAVVARPAPPPTGRPTPVRAAVPRPAPAVKPEPPRRAARTRPVPAAAPEPERPIAVSPDVQPSPVAAPSAGVEESAAVASPDRQERPALGTDLVAAQRAYRLAIEAYNARADEYNEAADAFQRLELNGDPDHVAAMRMRLDRARDDAERARTDAEATRLRMEAVEAKYR